MSDTGPPLAGIDPAAELPLARIDPATELPLTGVRVIEFTHMVMGPTCGMILADLGAEVVKIEPPGGDNTRRLLGSGSGFFAMFNRNKKSLAVDTKDPRGREIVLRLVAGADVFSENFKGGTMARLGFGVEALSTLNPRLVYVSHKGFLPGPYEHRTALDEVVQMMGGLAYMTGRPGDPLRAGSSVNDIMGGLFGAIGTLGALIQRGGAGKITAALHGLVVLGGDGLQLAFQLSQHCPQILGAAGEVLFRVVEFGQVPGNGLHPLRVGRFALHQRLLDLGEALLLHDGLGFGLALGSGKPRAHAGDDLFVFRARLA